MTNPEGAVNDVDASISKLVAHCRANNWAGYEPYDATNSPLFSSVPFLDSRIPRLVLTQLLKRMPFNIRPLMQIERTQNPKAIALFLSAFVELSKDALSNADRSVDLMIERLIALRSPGTEHWCWGYSFPWQTRTVLVPRWTPNLVCTSFAASALMEAFEVRREMQLLDMAVSAGEYLVKELFWTGDQGVAGFAYPLPAVRNQVHNANFLGADLLCRIYKHTGDRRLLDCAMKAAGYSASQQRPDGSWLYGERTTQAWIDNFHTGFNLSALKSIGHSIETTEFDSHIRRGLEFYRSYFFREDGAPRYYHNRTYPIDSHCVAQSIITLLDLRDLNPGNVALAHSVWRWAMSHLWDDRGFYYYRVLRSCTIRTSYMRWTQAWMLLALSKLRSQLARGVADAQRNAPVEA